MKTNLLRCFAATLFFLVTSILTAAPRQVVMGDLHGDLGRLVTILQESRLIDQDRKWVGGKARFITTGDFLDRGSQVRELMDLLMKLQKESRKKGGEVIVLLGNHEIMNLMGDLRYVAEEAYLGFASKKSEKVRDRAFKDYLKYRKNLTKIEGLQLGPLPDKEAWSQTHPFGYFEYREAMGRKGKYGRWIRSLPVAARVEGSIFLHGGIHPAISNFSLEEINKRIASEIEAFDLWSEFLVKKKMLLPFSEFDDFMEICNGHLAVLMPDTTPEQHVADINAGLEGLSPDEQDLVRVYRSVLSMGRWLSMNPNGPLWFRGFGTWTEEEGAGQITDLLTKLQAQRFVVGHTIRAERDVLCRFGGRVYLVDTIEPSALLIEKGTFRALYANGVRQLPTDWVPAEASGQPGLKPMQ